MKIWFKRDYEVKAVGGPKYKQGQVVDMSPASAGHFKRKRVAEDYDPKKHDEKPEPKLTAEDLVEEAAGSEEPAQCAFIKPDGEQCKNKALPGSDFCGIKSHKAAEPSPEDIAAKVTADSNASLGTAKRGRPSSQAPEGVFEKGRQEPFKGLDD